jgi:hypothetical protein
MELPVKMSQTQPQTTSLFRTSLRDWQANWKARQAAQSPDTAEQRPAPAAPAAPGSKTRVKRLVAHKLRKQRRQAAARSGG